MDRFDVDGVILTWHEDARMLEIAYADDAAPTRATAEAMAQWASRRLGDAPAGVLCDVANLSRTGVAYHAAMVSQMRGFRAPLTVACYHVPANAATILGSLAQLGRIPFRVFPTREESREWLLAAAPRAPHPSR